MSSTSTTLLLTLPDDFLLIIASGLTATELLQFARTCKYLGRLSYDNTLWSILVAHDYPIAMKRLNWELEWNTRRKQAKQDTFYYRYYRSRQYITSNWNKGESGAKMTHFTHHTSVLGIQLIGDTHVISAASDDASVKIWDLRNHTSVVNIPNAGTGLCLGYDPIRHHIITAPATSHGVGLAVYPLNLEKLERLSEMSVGELKQILRDKNVSMQGCLEKKDLVDRIRSSHAIPLIDSPIHMSSHHDAMIVDAQADGDIMVSCSHDGTVKLWDISQRACVKTLEGHQNGVDSIDLVKSQNTVMSGGKDAIICEWDLTTGALRSTIERHTQWIWCLALSPLNGFSLLGGDTEGAILHHDLRSRQLVGRINIQSQIAGISVDWITQRAVVTSFDGIARIIDLRMFKSRHSLHASWRLTRCRANENRIVTGSIQRDQITMWDFSHGLLV